MSLNKARVALLVEALRSGEYKQSFNALTLREDDGTLTHCCLGVACQVAIKNGLDVLVEDDIYMQGTCIQVAYDGRSGTLPESVRNWYGFDSHDPQLRAQLRENTIFEYCRATEINDYARFNFMQIADLFEQLAERTPDANTAES